MRRVALVIGRGYAYAEGVVRGVSRYATVERDWLIRVLPPGPATPAVLRHWRADGVIGTLSPPAFAARVARAVPAAVNVSNNRPPAGLPRVGVDDAAVGAAAAAHLLDRGVRALGFFGNPRLAFSRERCGGFAVAARAAGARFREFRWRADDALAAELDARPGRWLAALPRPAGVLAANDEYGWRAVDACRLAGLRVPDDVAVIGVDDDATVCALARPPLTSVAVPTDRVGYEAAALLDGLMAGAGPGPRARLLAPAGVVVRGSTDLVATDDPAVAEAVRFVRSPPPGRVLGVGDVADHVAVSRRALERRFRAALGRSVHDELQRARVERAKRLLGGTDWPLTRVAREAGFGSYVRMAVVFRAAAGEAAGAYRARFRRP